MSDVVDRYEITAYRPEFRADMLQLQQYLWGRDRERNAAHFHWKYERNPYSDTSFVSLALCEGQVIGTVALVAAEWEAGQPAQRFKCLTHADGIIHPDHRRRGLFERMTRAILRDAACHEFCYVIALSANPASAAGDTKLGWRNVGSLETASWHAARRERGALHTLAARLPLLSGAYRSARRLVSSARTPQADPYQPFATLDQGQARAYGAVSRHICMDHTPRPEAMAELIDRIGTDGRIRHSRDRRFFAWRFGNPLSAYRFLFWEDKRLEGYLVLQMPAEASDDAWIHIVDWEASDTQARADLLDAAIASCPSHLLVVWSATLPDDARALLQARGFRFSNMATGTNDGAWHPHVLVRSLDQDLPLAKWTMADRAMTVLANWDLRALYSDNF